jgi:hypothetical protein
MSNIINGGVVGGPSGSGPEPAITHRVTNIGTTTLQVGDLVSFDSDETETSGFGLGLATGVFSAVKRTTAVTNLDFFHAVVTKAPEGGAGTGDALEVFVGPGYATLRVGTVQSTPVAITEGTDLYAPQNQVFASEDGAQLTANFVQVAVYKDASYTPSAQLASELKTVFFDGTGETFQRGVSS